MNRLFRILTPLLVLFVAAAAAAEDAPAPDAAAAPETQAPAQQPESVALDFTSQASVVDLGPSLAPREVKNQNDRGAWYTVTVQNSAAAAPLARVFMAAESPSAGLRFVPSPVRARLIEAAGSEPGLVIERAAAFGDSAFRIIVPPMHTATLALHFDGVGRYPSVLAWTEPALIAHNRQISVLMGLVAGLLTAAMAFAAGAAVLSGRVFARWAALFLAALLIAQLATVGVFDNGWLTSLSGPYGLCALALAIAIAAAIRLVDYVGSFEALYPGTRVWRDRAAAIVVVLGFAAFAGIPLAGLLVRILAVIGAAGAAGHLAHCGRLGIAGARRLAPAATIFALVTAAAGFSALGVFGINLVAPAAIGGFSAAGAMLVALVTAVPIEPAMQRLRDFHEAHRHDDTQATVTDEAMEQQREIAAVTASHQGVFDLDLESGLLSLTAEASAMFGLPRGAVELSHTTWLARIQDEDRSVYLKALEAYRHDPGVAFRIEFRAAAAGGRTAWFELRATMTGQATEAERCLGLIADVSARKSAEAADLEAEHADALTGLGNRTALLARLEALREGLGETALAVFDLDRFKAVNDSLGHDGANLALKGFAARLEEAFARERREGRMVLFRAGGDMFAALGRAMPDMDAFGSRVLDLVGAPWTIDGRDVFLSTSVGVAAGDGAEDGLDLLGHAELAMVDAKREGGNRVSVYSGADVRTAPQDSVALETGLRRALEQGEIEVHYQPVIRLKDGGVAGFEALLRWRHPERGLIDPAEFVSHAERTGLIVPLGKFVLERALADLAHWQQIFPMKQPISVSVNVAWRQISDANFAKELSALLKRASIAKRSLKLEVTESAVMAGANKAEAALKRLKNLGVGLAIDDFGTGYSALSHLVRFPFDIIKIDKSFVDAAESQAGAAILASVIGLARDLKLVAVAEGVQSEKDVARLKEMGCEFGQGYFFGTAVPASEVDAFISAHRV